MSTFLVAFSADVTVGTYSPLSVMRVSLPITVPEMQIRIPVSLKLVLVTAAVRISMSVQLSL